MLVNVNELKIIFDRFSFPTYDKDIAISVVKNNNKNEVVIMTISNLQAEEKFLALKSVIADKQTVLDYYEKAIATRIDLGMRPMESMIDGRSGAISGLGKAVDDALVIVESALNSALQHRNEKEIEKWQGRGIDLERIKQN